MGKVTIAFLLVSSVAVLIACVKGIEVLRGAQEVASFMHWSIAAVCCVLAANGIAVVHAVQSDRVIRALRRVSWPEAETRAPGA